MLVLGKILIHFNLGKFFRGDFLLSTFDQYFLDLSHSLKEMGPDLKDSIFNNLIWVSWREQKRVSDN